MGARTKEERFLLKLYEMGLEFGNPKTPFPRNLVGENVGLSPKSVKTICVVLMQSNFIRKINDDEIALSDTGVALAKNLEGF